MSEESRTVWVGNFDPEKVTQDLLYELFLQVSVYNSIVTVVNWGSTTVVGSFAPYTVV